MNKNNIFFSRILLIIGQKKCNRSEKTKMYEDVDIISENKNLRMIQKQKKDGAVQRCRKKVKGSGEKVINC